MTMLGRPIRRDAWWAYAVVLELALCAAAVHAQSLEHAGSSLDGALALSYDEALALVERAPQLRSRALASQQLRAAKRDVTSLPGDLQLNAEAGPRVAPSLAAQGRVGVSQSFALTGLGDARRGAMEARAASLDAERTALSLQRRLRVVDAWLRVHVAHAALQIAQVELRLADELARATARGAELGELTRADAADSFAYAAEAKLGVLSSDGELIDARLELTRALALADRVADTRGDPPQLADPSAERERALHARVDQQPELMALVRRSAALGARARESGALYGSQVALGAVLDRTDPTAWAGLATISFTLPLRDRSLRERSELDSERTALQGETDEQRADLHVAIERLIHEIRHTHETLRHADEQLLPAIERGLEAREALFHAGEGTVLEIILARRSALVMRLRRLQLQGAWQSALLRFGELARAVGVGP